ncbi:hypothetical protein OAO18_09395, partial [Francisellaceae bacterium]|nr:hypothetical protein [Francisellaceae bacterium]
MKLGTIALSTILAISSSFAMANVNDQDTQVVTLGKTKIEFTINKGTQAAPTIGVAYKPDVKYPNVSPDVYWSGDEKAVISGDTQYNMHNATIDQFLKSTGNTASFRVLVNDGSRPDFIPTTTPNPTGQPLLAPAFDLSKGQVRKCTVSYI